MDDSATGPELDLDRLEDVTYLEVMGAEIADEARARLPGPTEITRQDRQHAALVHLYAAMALVADIDDGEWLAFKYFPHDL